MISLSPHGSSAWVAGTAVRPEDLAVGSEIPGYRGGLRGLGGHWVQGREVGERYIHT